jgi:Patatin-like phospholipase
MSWIPWVLWLVLSIVWYRYVFNWDTLMRTSGRISGHWFLIFLIVLVDLMAAGRLGADLGLPALFRDDPAAAFVFHSRAVWGACTTTYLIGLSWLIVYLFLFIDPTNYALLPTTPRPIGWNPRKGWAVPCQAVANFRDYHSALEFLAASMPPFLLLLLLIGALPADVIGGPAWTPQRALIETLEYFLGIALGIGILLIFVRLTWFLAEGILRLRDRIWPNSSKTLIARACGSTFWAVLLTNFLLSLYPLNAAQMVPSFAIGLLLCVVALWYLFIMATPRAFRVPLVLMLVAYVAWSNNGAFKYRFPGMAKTDTETYYDGKNPVNKDSKKGTPTLPLLQDEAVLKAWKKRLNEDKPKLVLLAVSGGGYRATFWTATVIDELEKLSRSDGTLKGLTDHIRLITGASGGMVGASYYAAMRADATRAGGKPFPSVVDTLENETHRDSLARVVQQLVQRDIPMIFYPLKYQKVDRGTVFEDEWPLLDRPFSSMLRSESDGSVPSLIVSPMIVETGERLLISNLDVGAIARPVSEAKIRYWSSAREFFEWFPGSQGTFGLKTAARMSASFPYVLPAVSLPTDPPVRIVDAGYYDNFGVNLAAAWAYQNREWILKETSGFALIQVYAFPREASTAAQPTAPDGTIAPVRKGSAAEPPPSVDSSAGELGAEILQRAFQWLSSPIEGGANARDWSMFYRNEEQLRLLDDTFNKPKDAPKFFERLIFTNRGHAALNVIITQDDIHLMQDDFKPPTTGRESANLREMDNLVRWWKGEAIDPAKRAVPPVPYQATTPGP